MHFNKLTPAEAERLAILVEECGEVIQAAGKILRHGYDSDGYDNRANLEKEIGDIVFITTLMTDRNDISAYRVLAYKHDKEANIHKYLHHN